MQNFIKFDYLEFINKLNVLNVQTVKEKMKADSYFENSNQNNSSYFDYAVSLDNQFGFMSQMMNQNWEYFERSLSVTGENRLNDFSKLSNLSDLYQLYSNLYPRNGLNRNFSNPNTNLFNGVFESMNEDSDDTKEKTPLMSITQQLKKKRANEVENKAQISKDIDKINAYKKRRVFNYFNLPKESEKNCSNGISKNSDLELKEDFCEEKAQFIDEVSKEIGKDDANGMHEENEKNNKYSKPSKFNVRSDCIRKRIKGLVHKYLLSKLNSILKEKYSDNIYIFMNLPRNFTVDVKYSFNKGLLQLNLFELFTIEVPEANENKKVLNNKNVIKHVKESDPTIWNEILNLKLEDIYNEYTKSNQYILDLETLKKKEGADYIYHFKYHMDTFISYYR